MRVQSAVKIQRNDVGSVKCGSGQTTHNVVWGFSGEDSDAHDNAGKQVPLVSIIILVTADMPVGI